MDPLKVGLWGARADSGGLAAVTYEFYRHVRPAKTLLIDMGRSGRGWFRPDWYLDGPAAGGVRLQVGYNDAISVDTVRDFADGLDVVYAAETFYREDVADIFREMGVATVLHAMPELYRRDMAQPDVVWAPTSWRLDLLPSWSRVVPVPVPTDTFSPEPGDTRRLLHVGAPAFHDRNGTELVRQALGYLTRQVDLVQTGPPLSVPPCRVRPRVEHRGEAAERRDVYRGCGALVLPRRYAGLSLPMQEAAALGFPIVTLDLEPQRAWCHAALLVPTTAGPDVRMPGGYVSVAEASPRTLASAIDRLVSDPELWEAASVASLAYARSIRWDRWAGRYLDLLAEVAR